MNDSDLSSGVHVVTADDVPFEAHWLHWSTLRTWPVHLAVAWAAYSSRAEIVQQGQRPTKFPREAEARAEVIATLIAGRLVAYGVPDPGNPWDSTVEIPAGLWPGLALRDSRTLSEPALKLAGNKVAFRSVEIETSRLFDLWPDPKQDFADKSVDRSSRQDDINAVAKTLPLGITKERSRKDGSRTWPFWNDLKNAFGSHVTKREMEEAYKIYAPTAKSGRPFKQA